MAEFPEIGRPKSTGTRRTRVSAFRAVFRASARHRTRGCACRRTPAARGSVPSQRSVASARRRRSSRRCLRAGHFSPCRLARLTASIVDTLLCVSDYGSYIYASRRRRADRRAARAAITPRRRQHSASDRFAIPCGL